MEISFDKYVNYHRKYILDVSKLHRELMDLKIMGTYPQKTFNNVLQWKWKTGRIVRIIIYEGYIIIEAKVNAPKKYSKKQIWITKQIIPAKIIINDKLDGGDEFEIIKNNLNKIAKYEIEKKWDLKINVFDLIKKIKEKLDIVISDRWFETEKSEIKQIDKSKYVLFYYCKSGVAGKNKLIEIIVEVSQDSDNIINIIIGGVDGKRKSATYWRLKPSDIFCNFNPYQNFNDICDMISSYVSRY